MGLGKSIEAARLARKWTQSELASHVPGLTQQALDRLEKRDSSKSAFAVGIAAAFGVSLEDLLAGAAAAVPPSSTDHAPVKQAPTTLEQALPVVLNALARLTPGRWAMVRARLDALPEQPQAVTAALADVAPVLGVPASAVATLLAQQASFETTDIIREPERRR